MFGKIFNLVSSILLLFRTGDAIIKDCGNGNSIFQITELALTPDPPIRGKDVYMTVKFINPLEDINAGKCTTSATLNFIPFQPTVEELCTSTQCPILSGLNDRSTSNVWPDTVSGSITSKITWTMPNDSLLLCIQIATKVAEELNEFSIRGAGKYYNQSDADILATLFYLNDPLPYNTFDNNFFDDDEIPYNLFQYFETENTITISKNKTNA
jgi:hypothetical protein